MLQCDMCFLNNKLFEIQNNLMQIETPQPTTKISIYFSKDFLTVKTFIIIITLIFFYLSCQVTWTQDEQPNVANYKS